MLIWDFIQEKKDSDWWQNLQWGSPLRVFFNTWICDDTCFLVRTLPVLRKIKSEINSFRPENRNLHKYSRSQIRIIATTAYHKVFRWLESFFCLILGLFPMLIYRLCQWKWQCIWETDCTFDKRIFNIWRPHLLLYNGIIRNECTFFSCIQIINKPLLCLCLNSCSFVANAVVFETDYWRVDIGVISCLLGH